MMMRAFVLLLLIYTTARSLQRANGLVSGVPQHRRYSYFGAHSTTTTTTTTHPRLSTTRCRLFPNGEGQNQDEDDPIIKSNTSKSNQSNNTPISPKHTTNTRVSHGLAILTMPTTSVDRIANDAILETALHHMNAPQPPQTSSSSNIPMQKKLSIVLRSKDDAPPASLSALRRYVGEVYSALWDLALEDTFASDEQEATTSTTTASSDASSSPQQQQQQQQHPLLDVVVYPQNLPNAAPEAWIHQTSSDLQWVCSHDSICGWACDTAGGRGLQYRDSKEARGGLEAHVEAVNRDRRKRHLPPVEAVPVTQWPQAASAWPQETRGKLIFMDDDDDVVNVGSSSMDGGAAPMLLNGDSRPTDSSVATTTTTTTSPEQVNLLGGAVINQENKLFNSVCCGGTFDGMHYGHRKLLTLAVSSVLTGTGKLLVGVTVDEMLQHKQYNHLIPPYSHRAESVKQFLHRLAPGMKNRIQIVPIRDKYGPPGSPEQRNGDFEALVLSHETLDTGHALNVHRTETLGLPPLTLLCTRRTEPNGMSSTNMRRLRSLRDNMKSVKEKERVE